jgi:hypothetical protein
VFRIVRAMPGDRPAGLPTGVSDSTTPIALNVPAPVVLW